MVTTTPEQSAAPQPPMTFDRLFEYVVGHENAKMLMRYSLASDEPVHVLLIGPVGTAKSMMLDDVAGLPNAEQYVGSTTTKSGLVGMLVAQRPRYLILDELDKADPTDMSPLLNLMEGGMVTRLQHRVQERVRIRTSVFGGANDTKRIPAPILSRFLQVNVPGYSPAEFIEVSIAVLLRRVPDMGYEQARNIAEEAVRYTTDIRDAVKVGRLTQRHPERVLQVVRAMWPKAAQIGPTPMTRKPVSTQSRR